MIHNFGSYGRVVFTAGTMGSGKSYTLDWLYEENALPLNQFVRVDLDIIRQLLPEYQGYIVNNPSEAGKLTQKEAGYIAELVTLITLKNNINVIVDGSLRDHIWYQKYFNYLRGQFPKLKIGIIEMTASLETCTRRAKLRSLETGRSIPYQLTVDTFNSVSISVSKLKVISNFSCTISNEYDDSPPQLISVSHGDLSLTGFKYVWMDL